MSYRHKGLSAGRWHRLPFVEKMANIGSEVGRAAKWRSKGNEAYCRQAFERSLELLDLTIGGGMSRTRLKELCRLREAVVDYFFGTNRFKSTETAWERYFSFLHMQLTQVHAIYSML